MENVSGWTRKPIYANTTNFARMFAVTSKPGRLNVGNGVDISASTNRD